MSVKIPMSIKKTVASRKTGTYTLLVWVQIDSLSRKQCVQSMWSLLACHFSSFLLLFPWSEPRHPCKEFIVAPNWSLGFSILPPLWSVFPHSRVMYFKPKSDYVLILLKIPSWLLSSLRVKVEVLTVPSLLSDSSTASSLLICSTSATLASSLFLRHVQYHIPPT